MEEKNKIIHSQIVKDVIRENYQNQLYGITKISYYNIKINKKHFYIGCRTSLERYLGINVYDLDFLKPINKINKWVSKLNKNKKCNLKCVECLQGRKFGKLYKYGNCGHIVHIACAIYSLNNGNKCSKCKKNVINQNIITCKKQEKDICVICLDDTDIVLYNCGHHFHVECLKELVNYDNKCPMCRETMCHNYKEISTFQDIPFNLGQGKTGTFNINLIKFS